MKLQCGSAKIITMGVAPAGGCTVLCELHGGHGYTHAHRERIPGIAQKIYAGNGYNGGYQVSADNITRLSQRAVGYAKRQPQVAPNGAIMNGMEVVCVSNVTAEMAIRQPIAEYRICVGCGEPGTFSLVLNFTIYRFILD